MAVNSLDDRFIMFNDCKFLKISRAPATGIIYTKHKEKGFGYRTKADAHRGHELIYVDYGRIVLAIEKRNVYLETGDIFIIHGGMTHHIHGAAKMPFNFLNIAFQGKLSQIIANRLIHLQLEERRLLLNLKEEAKKGLPFAGEMQVLRLNEFFFLLNRRLSQRLSTKETVAGENRIRYRNQVIQKTLDYLEQCSNRTLNPGEIAARIGLSASRLRYILKKETGQSIRRHVRHFRIETAKRLLRESIDNVETICFRVGYTSLPHFCSIFKKMVGMTPMEYSRSLGLPKDSNS